MRNLLSLLFLLLASVAQAQVPISQNQTYYVVGDTNPTTQVWNLSTGAMVANSNGAFQTWLSNTLLPFIQVTNAANNGSNLCRLTITSTTTLQYTIQTGQVVSVSGVVGATQCNGVFAITVFDAQHIDLVGSTAPSAYVSGGTVTPAPYFATMAGMLSAINNFNANLPTVARPNYQQVIGTSQVIGTNWPLYIQVAATAGSLTVTLPCANIPGSIPIGVPFVIQNNGANAWSLRTCGGAGTNVISNSAQNYYGILTSNNSQDGSINVTQLPNFNGPPSATNQIPVVLCGGGGCTANWVTQPPATQVATVTGVNFNSANTDNAVTLALPSGFTRVRLLSVSISNANHTLVTATCGVFTATAGGGVALVTSASAITVSATADATANNMQVFDRTSGLTTAAANTSFVASSLATPNTIYFRVQTAEGAAATGDVTVTYTPMP